MIYIYFYLLGLVLFDDEVFFSVRKFMQEGKGKRLKSRKRLKHNMKRKNIKRQENILSVHITFKKDKQV